jgi:hypothetical protein
MNELVAGVLEELDSHRARYESFCRSLTSEQLERPVPKSTWIVRDFIAHLATIDDPIAEMFRNVHAGNGGSIGAPEGGRWNVDDWNDGQVASRRERSVEEVLAEAAASRAQLRVHLAALDDSDVAHVMRFGGDSKRPPGEIRLGQFIQGWCKHDPMHAVDMMRGLPELASPELEAWFDDPIIKGYQAAMNPGPA